MKVRNFSYDGFCGRLMCGYADYTAKFKEWTDDPGVTVCLCSDGKERLVPTFALDGFDKKAYPEQNTENKVFYIGESCHS